MAPTTEPPADEPPPRVPFSTVKSHPALDHVLRTVQQTQVQLSAMAETKANMMITVCSIVMTLSITQLEGPLMRWPLVILTATSMVSLLLAIMAALPLDRFPSTPSGELDTNAPWFNLLFFGHFARMPQDRFETLLEEMMTDEARLYGMIARDIYGQGIVLALKKYRMLRYSYMVFLLGVLSTAIGTVMTITGAS